MVEQDKPNLRSVPKEKRKEFASKMPSWELEITLRYLDDQIHWDEMQARTIPEHEARDRKDIRDIVNNELIDRLLCDSDSPTDSNSPRNND